MSKPDPIRWKESSGAAANAREHLPALVSAYFAEGRHLLQGQPKAAQLHTLRLATKRLRYTLELFRPCYGPGFRPRLAALRRLQQFLGEINDCATAAAELASPTVRKSPQHARGAAFLAQRSRAKTAEFLREWRQAFDAPGQERWWTTYLVRHARTPGRKP